MRDIWLFFDPTRNPLGTPYIMRVRGRSLYTYVQDLDWAVALKQRFRFKPDEPTMLFWKVGYQPRHSPPPLGI